MQDKYVPTHGMDSLMFEALKPRNQEAKKPRHRETKKPRNKKPRNFESKQQRSQETSKPRNREPPPYPSTYRLPPLHPTTPSPPPKKKETFRMGWFITDSNMCFSLPVIILSTLTGVANFAQSSFPIETRPIVSVVIGSLNIIAGLITTIAQFLKVAEKWQNKLCL